MPQETTQPHYHIMSSLLLKFNHLNNNLFVHQVFNRISCSDIGINLTCHSNHHSINHLSTTQHFHLNNNFLLAYQIPLQPLPWPPICLQSNVIYAVLSTNNSFISVRKSEWWQWNRRHWQWYFISYPSIRTTTTRTTTKTTKKTTIWHNFS